jgi:hypothetical protein
MMDIKRVFHSSEHGLLVTSFTLIIVEGETIELHAGCPQTRTQMSMQKICSCSIVMKNLNVLEKFNKGRPSIIHISRKSV